MAQKRSAKLDPRLAATAALVRSDAIFADIGCDHGYLAIELMRRGAVRGFATAVRVGRTLSPNGTHSCNAKLRRQRIWKIGRGIL